MSERRRGLGRGLGALIPTEATEADALPAHRTVNDVFFAPPVAGDPAAEPGAVVPDDDEWDRTIDLRAGSVGQRRTRRPGTRSPGAPADAPAGGEEVVPAAAPGAAPTNDLVPVPGARFAELAVTAIAPNPRQPRREFSEDAHQELVLSVREVGVLQPVVVRPVGGARAAGSPERPGQRYELVMGERRWRACRDAGLDVVPAIVRETSDDALLRDALLENLHRTDLNPLEEAAAYQQLLDDFGCTHVELGQRIGKSRPQISNTIRLLRLPPPVQRRVAASVLSAGHARALLGLGDASAMERLAARIVAEGLSVRATEEIVALGGDAVGAARPERRPGSASSTGRAFVDLGTRLSDRFDTRVSVSMGQRKGKLTVEFASLEDLNRILGTLAPEDPGVDGSELDEGASGDEPVPVTAP